MFPAMNIKGCPHHCVCKRCVAYRFKPVQSIQVVDCLVFSKKNICSCFDCPSHSFVLSLTSFRTATCQNCFWTEELRTLAVVSPMIESGGSSNPLKTSRRNCFQGAWVCYGSKYWPSKWLVSDPYGAKTIFVQGADLKLKDQITPHVKPSDCYAEKVVN